MPPHLSLSTACRAVCRRRRLPRCQPAPINQNCLEVCAPRGWARCCCRLQEMSPRRPAGKRDSWGTWGGRRRRRRRVGRARRRLRRRSWGADRHIRGRCHFSGFCRFWRALGMAADAPPAGAWCDRASWSLSGPARVQGGVFSSATEAFVVIEGVLGDASSAPIAMLPADARQTKMPSRFSLAGGGSCCFCRQQEVWLCRRPGRRGRCGAGGGCCGAWGGVFSSSAAELAALGAVNGGAHAVPHDASLADTTRTQQLPWCALALEGLLQLPPAGGVAPQTGE